jgi:hypothetical protein
MAKQHQKIFLIKSVSDENQDYWAAPEEFFSTFQLQSSMFFTLPSTARFTFDDKKASHQIYYGIKRDAKWAILYSAMPGPVWSDDFTFFDELAAESKYQTWIINEVRKTVSKKENTRYDIDLKLTVN